MTTRGTDAQMRWLFHVPTAFFLAAGLLAGAGGLLRGGSGGRAAPAGAGDPERRQLYRTPGGLYTAADIRANGGGTPEACYPGFHPAHDPSPARGEAICPVTRTKANPRLVWSVGGRRYLFCCPPCIDEFVRRAKSEPESIRPPEAYVKR